MQEKVPLRTKIQRHYCSRSLDPKAVKDLENIWERSAILGASFCLLGFFS